MARFGVISDIHADYSAKIEPWVVPQGLDVDAWIVAGDYRNGGLRKSLKEVARDFESYLSSGVAVVYVPGNHDFYGAALYHELERAPALADELGITLLASGETSVIAGVRVVGATLWTDYRLHGDTHVAQLVGRSSMNDYRHIRTGLNGRWWKLSPSDTIEQHHQHRASIEAVLQTPFEGKTVVVTHHAPSPKGLREGLVTEILDNAYASDLEPVIETLAPDLWVHGHCHVSREYRIGSTRLVQNPRGYVGWAGARQSKLIARENPHFQPDLVVEV